MRRSNSTSNDPIAWNPSTSEAVPNFRVHPVAIIELTEQSKRRAMEHIDAEDQPPVRLHVPYHARTQHPVGAIETLYIENFRLQSIAELPVQQHAESRFVPLENDVRVVIEKRAVEQLQIEPGVGRQREVESADEVERVLPHDAIVVGQAQHVVAPPARIDGLGLEHRRPKILRERTADLVDLVVARLIDERRLGNGDDLAIERGL